MSRAGKWYRQEGSWPPGSDQATARALYVIEDHGEYVVYFRVYDLPEITKMKTKFKTSKREIKAGLELKSILIRGIFNE